MAKYLGKDIQEFEMSCWAKNMMLKKFYDIKNLTLKVQKADY